MTVAFSVARVLTLLLVAEHAWGQASQGSQSPANLKKLSLDALQQIEVTSVSRRPEQLSGAPSSIQVITGDDIRRSGATSIGEALRLASNLQVAQIDSHDFAITARGFNNPTANKLLVMIDGRVVYLPLHAGVYWDMQDTVLDNIDRIEVISGPGATLWGSNAVNGVINITTKQARDTQGVLLEGSGGSQQRGAFGMRYGGQIGQNLQFRAHGKYFDRDSSALPAGGQAVDDWQMGQGGFRLDWEASAVTRVTVQGDLYDGDVRQQGTNNSTLSGGNALARWSRTLSPTSDLSLQVDFDRVERGMPGLLYQNIQTYQADFQHRLRVTGAHSLVWGLGYRASESNQESTPLLTISPAHLTRAWLSAFVQDEMPVGSDRLRLTVGTKLERNDYTGLEVQPSGRLAWTLPRRQMLWGAVSRAVRTPSQVDRGFFLPLPGTPLFLIAGGPDFHSEILRAYEVGYRSQPHDRVAATVATFYNDYDDVRSLERVSPVLPFPMVFANGQRGTAYGAELTAEYFVTDWWRIRSGFTAQRIRIRAKPGSTDTSQGRTEVHDPSHFGTLRHSLDLPANLQLDLGFRFVARIVNQNVPAYRELDARIAWLPRPWLEWSIAGQNLLHARHPEFGELANRREAERNVQGKVAWRF
jgi:iron complex outermembrane receptor protein